MNPLRILAPVNCHTGRLILCCLVIALSGNRLALAAAPVYDVEVVIFSNQNSGDGGERWPTSVPDRLALLENSTAGEISKLPASSYRLNGISNALRQSRGYSVLYHAAWRQPAYDNGRALAYPINERVRNGSKQLAGQIKLVRERYLHLDVDLFLTSAAAVTASSYTEGPGGSPVYELSEKRRIKKSGVLHYFDHPRFGMIAIITPYVSPQAQQQREDKEAEMEAEMAAEEPVVEEEPLPEDDQLTR